MDTQQQIESIESDIKEAQKKLAESEQKLNALKAEQSKPQVNYDGQPQGFLWDRWEREAIRVKQFNLNTVDGAIYATKEEAEWQGNSERVRRKLQRIAKRLNPPGWGPTRDLYTIHHTGIFFSNTMALDKAVEILGDDLKYLNWYESPEFKK